MTPQFDQISTELTNGGRDKMATLFLKQGRKVLELRSWFSTSCMGQLRHTFEAILWNGPACRMGITCHRELLCFPLALDPRHRVTEFSGVDDTRATKTPLSEILRQHLEPLTQASQFTLEEFKKAARC